VNLYRYQVSRRVRIAAPRQRVYTLATDPRLIPRYSREVRSLRLLDPPGRVRRARCRIRVAPGLSVPARYRYHYRPGVSYAGVQVRCPLVRSYFGFSFRDRRAGATEVLHIEGFRASVPLLAPILGWLYFTLLNRGGLRAELDLLRALAEGCPL
jgi:hypothetical protein